MDMLSPLPGEWGLSSGNPGERYLSVLYSGEPARVSRVYGVLSVSIPSKS